MFGELFLPDGGDPIPLGLKVGSLVHGLRITGGFSGALEEQARRAFALMTDSITSAGGSLDNIAHVSFFFADLPSPKRSSGFAQAGARPGIAALNPLWVETFPDAEDRPTYKFMQAPLAAGQHVHIGYFAVLGARRRVLAVPGVAHTNPIPLGVAIGDYLFSSRILPHDPATGAPDTDPDQQAVQVFANASALLAAGGFSWRDVVQGRAFLADDSFASLVEPQWSERLGTGANLARLHRVHYAGAPALKIMLELFAQRGARP